VAGERTVAGTGAVAVAGAGVDLIVQRESE